MSLATRTEDLAATNQRALMTELGALRTRLQGEVA